jgi:hypothetical protein
VGLLDDLRREADLAREAKETEAARQAELQKIYRSEMAPRLAGIYRYLTEMIEHLETVGWVVEAAYGIPGVGRVENLRQGDYRLYIDSHESPRKITLQFACGAKEERKFSLQAAEAEEFRQFLVGHQVAFSEWPLRDNRGQINGTAFQVKLRVKAGVLFEADIPSSRVRVVSHNVEGLSRREYLFGYAAVDDSWLDELGHYLLRKKDVLGGRQLSEAARERLRQLAAEQARAEQQPSPPAETVPDQGEKEAGKAGMLRALRNRLFGTDK